MAWQSKVVVVAGLLVLVSFSDGCAHFYVNPRTHIECPDQETCSVHQVYLARHPRLRGHKRLFRVLPDQDGRHLVSPEVQSKDVLELPDHGRCDVMAIGKEWVQIEKPDGGRVWISARIGGQDPGKPIAEDD